MSIKLVKFETCGGFADPIYVGVKPAFCGACDGKGRLEYAVNHQVKHTADCPFCNSTGAVLEYDFSNLSHEDQKLYKQHLEWEKEETWSNKLRDAENAF